MSRKQMKTDLKALVALKFCKLVINSEKEKLSRTRWHMNLFGPPNTPYENGTFKLSITFTDGYPFRPPKIIFETKIFHLNFGSGTEVSIGNLMDCNPIYNENPTKYHTNLIESLKTIYSLLKNPCNQCICNYEIHRLYNEHKQVYNKIARQWTLKFAIKNGINYKIIKKELKKCKNNQYLSNICNIKLIKAKPSKRIDTNINVGIIIIYS